ncbi:sigma-70 family RNA polymerase sigma factor [Dongia sp. agr-C8]
MIQSWPGGVFTGMQVALAQSPGPIFLRVTPRPSRRAVMGSEAPMPESSDAGRMTALLLRVAAADRAAFAELYGHYGPRLRVYMRKLGADAAASEDLVQEAMAAVWNKARLFDPAKANASTWIFTIARNRRIDLIRRERRPEIDAEDPSLQAEAPDSPEETMITRRNAAAIRAALAELPPDQAEVIRMSFFEDRPHGAIAAALGVPLGTVKSRLRLAFRRFRKALGETE